MPVPVTKYTCVFRCGKRASGDKATIEGHEHHCWKNPENKTCKTCSNEVYYEEGSYSERQIVRSCKIQVISETLESIQDILKGSSAMHIKPIQHCEYHNKPEDENSEQFARQLEYEARIKNELGTTHIPYYTENKSGRKLNFKRRNIIKNEKPNTTVLSIDTYVWLGARR